MRRAGYLIILAIILTGFVSTSIAQAQTSPRIGVRAGIGTDINLGLAYGVGVNYLLDLQRNSLELGVVFFGGSFEETSEEGIYIYEETTDIAVFGLLANYMINYEPGTPGTFFIAGFGLASVNVEWEERSPNDVSLGPLLPDGGSMQSADGSAGGTVFNLGFGRTLTNGFDLRAELPVIVPFDTPGEAATVIPTLIVTAGKRF